MNFTYLQNTISTLDNNFRLEAGKSVNYLLTLRNWLVGFYIVEFEQHGEDRAEYGERLLEKLAIGLNKSGLSLRNLKLFRQFYLIYPQLQSVVVSTLSEKQLLQMPSSLHLLDKNTVEIGQTLSAQSDSLSFPPIKLVNSLSFSQFVLIMAVENPLARAFYEIESIRGNWSVRELKRQIHHS